MPLYQLGVCYAADAVQPEPAALEAIMRDVSAVGEEMVAAGVWVFSGGLTDRSSATTVFEQDGQPVITDGPFVETKEQIGGYSLVDVADLDEAIVWARKISAATTTPIEIRPFLHATTK